MANNVKVGDVVQLNSGGPHMTVTEVDPTTPGKVMALCQWFKDGKVDERWFDVGTLRLVP
jgi:uncharacterized protein YodC (DUF2158 family)